MNKGLIERFEESCATRIDAKPVSSPDWFEFIGLVKGNRIIVIFELFDQSNLKSDRLSLGLPMRRQQNKQTNKAVDKKF